MDPITAAITAALAALAAKAGEGLLAGMSDTAKQAIGDAYTKLKTLLGQKCGPDSRVLQAVADVEQNPDTVPYQAVLDDQVKKAGAHTDPDLSRAAEALLALVTQQPQGGSFVQTIIGNYNAVSGHGGTSTVTVNQPPAAPP